MSRLLEGKRVVVAGSSRGIGRAVAIACADEGASLVVNGRATVDDEAAPLDEVVAEIENRGARAVASHGSVADFESAGRLVQTCVDTFGGIDALINCAGIAEPPACSILDISSEDWRELIDIHLTGTFNTCRHAAPLMVAQGSGAIVNTSSHAFLGGYAGTGYAAGKGGTNSLSFAIASDLREAGVRCNVVCPGARTRLSSGEAYEAKIEDLHRRGLLPDMMRDASLSAPEASFVGPLYAFLVSDRAAGVSGRLLSAVGGYVGILGRGRESMLAYREPERGPWSLDELAQALEGSRSLVG